MGKDTLLSVSQAVSDEENPLRSGGLLCARLQRARGKRPNEGDGRAQENKAQESVWHMHVEIYYRSDQKTNK